MKILVTSDWHGDWVSGGFERHDEVFKAVDETERVAFEEEVDLYLMLGDLTDPDVNLPLAHRTIARSVEVHRRLENGRDGAHRSIEDLWVVGNHDVVEDGRGSHTLMALEKAGATVDARPTMHEYVEDDRRSIWVMTLPYPSMTEKYDPIESLKLMRRQLDPKDTVIIAGHMTKIPSFEPGSESGEMARGREMIFPVDAAVELFGDRVVLLNGHYHKQQAVRRKPSDVLVPGALIRCTHGEEHHMPGYLILEV